MQQKRANRNTRTSKLEFMSRTNGTHPCMNENGKALQFCEEAQETQFDHRIARSLLRECSSFKVEGVSYKFSQA